jgi:hypothetical protein
MEHTSHTSASSLAIGDCALGRLQATGCRPVPSPAGDRKPRRTRFLGQGGTLGRRHLEADGDSYRDTDQGFGSTTAIDPLIRGAAPSDSPITKNSYSSSATSISAVTLPTPVAVVTNLAGDPRNSHAPLVSQNCKKYSVDFARWLAL